MTPTPEGAALYLDFDGQAGHAVLHEPHQRPHDTAVLMVAPFGWEDVSSYRSRRTWAISLAQDGFPTMRFDLPGTGDSAGTPEDPSLFDAWVRATATAAGELRSLSQCTNVAAIGVGLGGLLACAASAGGAAIDELVLWATPSRGRAILRELKAFSQLLGATVADAPPLPDGALSVNGYLMSAETVAAVAALDVRTSARPRVRRALLLSRDDLPVDDALRDALRDGGASVTVVDGPGYGAFIAPPHESQPSEQVMAAVSTWLGVESTTGSTRGKGDVSTAAIVTVHGGIDVRERLVSLATPAGDLSGVLTEPLGDPRQLCAVLLNAGSIRRTGPSDMWVDTARRWAARGVPTLRLDLAGLGDSTGDTTFPLEVLELYEAEFGDQVSSTLDGLEALGLPGKFVLMGLCSGAYWSFQTGQRDVRVAAVVMLNPRALVIDPFVEALRSAGNFRGLVQPAAWLRLFSGRTPLAHIKAVPRTAVRAALHAPAHLAARRRARAEVGGDELDLGFHRLHDNGVRAVLVFSAREMLRVDLLEQGRLDDLHRWPNLDLHLLDGSVETHLLQPLHVRQQVNVIIDRALDGFFSGPENGARST